MGGNSANIGFSFWDCSQNFQNWVYLEERERAGELGEVMEHVRAFREGFVVAAGRIVLFGTKNLNLVEDLKNIFRIKRF